MLKMFGAGGVVMPSCTEAKMTVGIFAFSMVSRAAKVALLQPPPIRAKAWSWWMSFLTGGDGGRRVATVVLANQLSLRPLMPPGRVDLVENHLDAVHGQLAVEIAGARQRAERCRS